VLVRRVAPFFTVICALDKNVVSEFDFMVTVTPFSIEALPLIQLLPVQKAFEAILPWSARTRRRTKCFTTLLPMF
jgi:hypothetical protein